MKRIAQNLQAVAVRCVEHAKEDVALMTFAAKMAIDALAPVTPKKAPKR